MNNVEFLEIIKNSFKIFLNLESEKFGKGSRSNEKLKPLHGQIAKDLQEYLGKTFKIKSLGYGNGKESKIFGRYYEKTVDISITKNKKDVASYGIKFVMQNYSQNSNNYFENMLGETANIRTNKIPYFQIFIIFEKVPHYDDKKAFKNYDIISQHNLDKYIKLSQDNADIYFHTPNKMLFVVVKLKEKEENYKFKDKNEYIEFYKSIINDKNLMQYSNKISDNFDNGIILNDYENFLERTCSLITGSLK
ncbi:hypothetical protein [Campylobacter sp. JMF_08 NE1]|uniref:hypothetical protein n=1 Tax=Campylobacter sp. JMF_08 NE1 TaxID=2983821 RepID=UPI0022E9CE4D|nr:hypothetical protein [Campylobacter sp. JMF_08 NE1]MDA3048398.1 hypothetical protein [Campylobacter sp. JMF_08 NE1]